MFYRLLIGYVSTDNYLLFKWTEYKQKSRLMGNTGGFSFAGLVNMFYWYRKKKSNKLPAQMWLLGNQAGLRPKNHTQKPACIGRRSHISS